MKRLSKIFLAGALMLVLLAGFVPVLEIYAKDAEVPGQGIIEAAPSSSSSSTSSSSSSSQSSTNTGGASSSGGGGTSSSSSRPTGGSSSSRTSSTSAIPTAVASSSSSSRGTGASQSVAESDVESTVSVDSTTVLVPDPIPLFGASSSGSWSIFNLVVSSLCLVVAAVLTISDLVRKRSSVGRIILGLAGILPIVVFLITNSFKGDPVVFDSLSIVYGAIFVLYLLLALFLRRRAKDSADDSEKA